jgi:hypothetical protein
MAVGKILNVINYMKDDRVMFEALLSCRLQTGSFRSICVDWSTHVVPLTGPTVLRSPSFDFEHVYLSRRHDTQHKRASFIATSIWLLSVDRYNDITEILFLYRR